jgi:hypothetical protein
VKCDHLNHIDGSPLHMCVFWILTLNHADLKSCVIFLGRCSYVSSDSGSVCRVTCQEVYTQCNSSERFTTLLTFDLSNGDSVVKGQ